MESAFSLLVRPRSPARSGQAPTVAVTVDVCSLHCEHEGTTVCLSRTHHMHPRITRSGFFIITDLSCSHARLSHHAAASLVFSHSAKLLAHSLARLLAMMCRAKRIQQVMADAPHSQRHVLFMTGMYQCV